MLNSCSVYRMLMLNVFVLYFSVLYVSEPLFFKQYVD